MAHEPLLEPERFGHRYAASGEAAPRAAELEALGSDYSATGYTTREQADGLGPRALALLGTGEHLPIRPGSIDAIVHADVLC